MALSLSINNRNGPGGNGRQRNARIRVATAGAAYSAQHKVCGASVLHSNPAVGKMAEIAIALICTGSGAVYKNPICGRKRGLM